jgi:hypothetical protein
MQKHRTFAANCAAILALFAALTASGCVIAVPYGHGRHHMSQRHHRWWR